MAGGVGAERGGGGASIEISPGMGGARAFLGDGVMDGRGLEDSSSLSTSGLDNSSSSLATISFDLIALRFLTAFVVGFFSFPNGLEFG